MLRKLDRKSVLFEISLLSIFLVMFSSCINTRKAKYFPDALDGTIATNTPIPEAVIQQNDILSITISSPNEEASAILNTEPARGTEGIATSATLGSAAGYLVGVDGTVQLPLLGPIKAAGLTKDELQKNIVKVILDKKLLVEPLVSIRFMNFRVTVLGEVNRPSVVSVPNEKISLLEAIGLAGDITIYGKKENVMVIREDGGRKTITRLNLNSNEIFTSPYYYLRSNDIVYVEPNKAKVASAGRSNQWLPILFSGLSLAAIVADRVIQ